MSDAGNNEELMALLDDKSYAAILNTSSWPPTQLVTMTNKHSLIQILVTDELVERRAKSISLFGSGLEKGSLLEVIRRFPVQCRALFVYEEKPLTASIFLGLVSAPRPEAPLKACIYEWFLEYVRCREDSTGKCTKSVVG